jgi:hypothetical protein
LDFAGSKALAGIAAAGNEKGLLLGTLCKKVSRTLSGASRGIESVLPVLNKIEGSEA